MVTLSPWAESIHNIITWLESKRVSPPFHKSRLLLILKDVLCGRQSASLLLFVQPTAQQHDINFEWMRLIARISRDTNNDNAADNFATADNSPTKANHHLHSDQLSLSQAPTVNLQSNNNTGAVGKHSSQFNRSMAAAADGPTGAVGGPVPLPGGRRSPGNSKIMSQVHAPGSQKLPLQKQPSVGQPLLQQQQESELSFLDTPMLSTQNSTIKQPASAFKRSNSNNDVANLHLQGNAQYATSTSNVRRLSTPAGTASTQPTGRGGPKAQSLLPQSVPHTQSQFRQQVTDSEPAVSMVPAVGSGGNNYVDDFSHREVMWTCLCNNYTLLSFYMM